MSNLTIVTKTNGDELKKLINRYNLLINELQQVTNEIANFGLDIQTRTIKIPESEM